MRIPLAWVILANTVALSATPGVAVIEQAQSTTPAAVNDGTLVPMASIPSSPFRVTSGGSFILMTPTFESNPAFTTSVVRAGQTQRTVQEFSYDYGPAMRFWVGTEFGNGYGLRARWFHYNQNSQSLDAQNDPIALGSPVFAQTIAGTSPLLAIGPQTGLPTVFSLQIQGVPGTTDRLHFESRLSFNVWDLEGTVGNMQIGPMSLQAAAGVRIARVEQYFSSTLVGNTTQFLNSEQKFHGVGPTVEIAGRAPFGMSNLSGFGNVRLAMLYGKDEHRVTGTNMGLTPPFAMDNHDDYSSRNRFVPAVEMETGVEQFWRLDRAELFIQASVLAQLWPIGGGAQPNGNMSMLGFAFGAGMRY